MFLNFCGPLEKDLSACRGHCCLYLDLPIHSSASTLGVIVALCVGVSVLKERILSKLHSLLLLTGGNLTISKYRVLLILVI